MGKVTPSQQLVVIPPHANREDTALIVATYDILAKTPSSCDFDVVRACAAEKLNVSAIYFAMDNQDPWYYKSMAVIKWAVVCMVEIPAGYD